MLSTTKAIDPIIILKEHIRENKKIEKQGHYLIFSNGVKLRLETPTAFIQSQTDKKQYTLGSLWFYLKHRDDPLSVYKAELQKEKIDTVVGVDKDPIIDFFINDNNDVRIIEEDLREKTCIYLGRKMQQTENLEKVMDEEYKKSGKGESMNNSQNMESMKYKNPVKKPRMEDLDPNLQIMDYIYTRQKHSLNRNSVLRPMAQLIGFESLLSLCRKTFTNNKKYKDSHIETLSFLDELISGEDLGGNKAIIIVPPTYHQGSLSIDNARQFIVDANYFNPTKSEDLLVLQNNRIKNIFTKKIKGKELNFEIHSNVRNFSKSDWKRVVAVFLQGSDWEFTEWPKNESITSILLKIKGFHLKYSDLPTNENIKKWNVKILEVNRTKRHFDSNVQNQFWTILDEFLEQPRYRDKSKVNK